MASDLIPVELKPTYKVFLVKLDEISSVWVILDHIPFKTKIEQAGTGPSRRHIQGSKIAKRLPSVKYSFTVLENRNFLKKIFLKKLHTQKNGPSGAPGLASASPWRAKVSQCRKTERGRPFEVFQHPFCRKT